MQTLTTYLTALRERLGESTARQWTEVELRRWLIEGAKDIARRAECLQSTATVAAVAGTQSYVLSAITPAIVRIHRAEYFSTGSTVIYPLEYRDLHAMDSAWGTHQSITTGTPVLFTLWGFPPTLTFKTYPTPSVAGTFTFYYYRLPTTLATDGSGDASNLETPDGWEDLILDYAEYHALRKDYDERWKDVLAAYETRFLDLLSTSQRWSDQGGMMVPTGGGFLPGWLVNG